MENGESPVEIVTAIGGSAIELWRGVALGSFEKAVVKVLLIAAAIYLIVYAIERLAGTRTANYRSQSFAQDCAYWFYYRTGIHDILFMVAILAAVEKPLSFVAIDLLTPLPFAAQVVAYLVVGDFIAYWIHRAEHRFRFMWAFHTTHHSQEHLTFATTARFHPVEMIYHNLLAYIPLRMMGIEPQTWLPVYLATTLYAAIQHTQIPWKLGPLYKIFATPPFHAYHHSTDPAHHDKNFSNMFSIWDHLFSTATRDDEPAPTAFGLRDLPAPSLLGSLVAPFRLLYQFYVAPARRHGIGKP